MKRILTIAISVLILGCEPSDDSNTNPNISDDFNLITEIVDYRGEVVQKIHNNENRIYQIFSRIDRKGYQTYGRWYGYEFQYNSQDKIKSIYSKEFLEFGNELTFEEMGESLNNPDNLLISFKYNSSGQIQMIENLFQYPERLVFEHSNGKVSSILIEEKSGSQFEPHRKFYFYYDEIGNITKSKEEYLQFDSENITEYDFDDKLNPFNQYYENFGLVGYIRGSGIDEFISFLSKNNPIGRVDYADDVEYDYNENNLPVIINYKSDNAPRTTTIKY